MASSRWVMRTKLRGSPGNVRESWKKYVAKDVINAVLYIQPFSLA